MKNISQQLMLIKNIYNVAIFHKENCRDAQCGVSLTQLKMAAEQISLGLINPEEINEYKKLEWPI